MSKNGILTIVSGFSGVGKGSVMKALLQKYDSYQLSVSVTTRSQREGEINGREYFFLTREEFECMIRSDELIEWAEYVGNYYGTPKQFVMKNLEAGKNVILEIEMQGALKIKEKFPKALLLFITAPDAQTIKNRLTGRGTESFDLIEKRMLRAKEEADFMEYYDYLAVNDVLEECVDMVHHIIESQQNRVLNRQEFIESIKKELMSF